MITSLYSHPLYTLFRTIYYNHGVKALHTRIFCDLNKHAASWVLMNQVIGITSITEAILFTP